MIECVDVTQYLNLVANQYQSSTKLRATISGILNIIQTYQIDTICEFNNNSSKIDNATGWLLDRIGINFGYARPTIIIDGSPIVVDDTIYKILLKLWIANIFYDGTTRAVNFALTNAFGKGFIVDYNNLSADVWVFNTPSDIIKAVVQTKILSKVAGVRYVYYRSILDIDTTFGFAGSGCNTFNHGTFANEFIGE